MPHEVIDASASSEILKSDVALPLEPALLTPAQRMLKDIEDLVIDGDPMYGIAGDELARVKGAYNKLEEERLELTRPLDSVKKKIMARYARPLEVLKAAEDALKAKMLAFHTERERRAAEERRKAEEAARAERDRLAREAAEIERKAQEAARLAREKAQAEAEQLAASGRAAEAQAAKEAAEVAEREALERAEHEAAERRQTAAVVVAAPTETVAPVAAGTAVRTTWKARVTDKAALIKAVAEQSQFENLLEVNDTALNALARSLKANFRLPGIEVYEERGMSARAR